MSTEEQIERLRALRDEAEHAGSQRAMDKQHEAGKMTARERIDAFLDKGSFVELDMFARHQASGFGIEDRRPYGDAVVTGWGTVDGRTVFVFAEDFTVFGGSLGRVVSDKVVKVMDLAMQTGAPLVGLKDSGGARIQEGVESLDGYGHIFSRNVKASGVIPQISVIMGPCAGGAVYSPAMTDFVYQVDGQSHLFITGPDVIKTVTGEEVTLRRTGRGQAARHRVGCDPLRQRRRTPRPRRGPLPAVVPPHQQHGGAAVLHACATARTAGRRNSPRSSPTRPTSPTTWCDWSKRWWTTASSTRSTSTSPSNIVVGFARLDGYTVGIVGNQPAALAGTLDIDASSKAARFVRFCDAFNIPLVTFVDVPGFLPGVDQEHGGIIRHGAKLLYAFCEATVPRVTVITRKAYGGAYVVMNSRSVGADAVFAWPTAQIAVMGAQGAVNIIHRRELAEAEDPEATRTELVDEYEEQVQQPLRRRRTGPGRRGDRTAGDPAPADPGPGDAADQAESDAAQEAWEHPAMRDDGFGSDRQPRRDRRQGDPRHQGTRDCARSPSTPNSTAMRSTCNWPTRRGTSAPPLPPSPT